MKFHHYLLRRLALTVFTLLGVLLVTFFVSHVIPADPVGAILGPQAPPELIAKIRHELGFDRPVPVQFALYLKNILQGDFGESLRTQNPVLDDLRRFFPATLELATSALLIGIFLGVPLGILSAVKKNQLSDHIGRIFSLGGLSMPVFWLALILLLIFYYRLGWLPGPGQVDPYMFPSEPITGLLLVDSLLHREFDIFINALQHLVMPAFVLGYFSTAAIVRVTRSSMLEVMSLEYIQTARAKGLRERVVIYKHALKNAMIPVMTTIGLTYGSLLEGSVLTETIFAWPGLGRYMTSAFLFLDFNAVMGGTLLIALIFSLANLTVDLLYAVLNPKIRYG